MDPAASHVRSSVRARVEETLREAGVKVTPQARESIVDSLLSSNPEVAGDSDSVLLGLLLSGSYTVDILEDAGVKASRLRELARASATKLVGPELACDPLESFFGGTCVGSSLIDAWRGRPQPLETADLLRAAIRPESRPPEEYGFPVHLRKGKASTLPLHRDLEAGVCELISYACFELGGTPGHDLSRRRRPLTLSERDSLGHSIGSGEDLEYVIRAVDSWFVDRSILTDPPARCLRALNAYSPFGYALRHFTNVGGDLKVLDAQLNFTTRFSPERDMPCIGIFARDGRLHLGEYTYRNRLAVDSGISNEMPIRPVHVQAIRPVPLVSGSTLKAFEQLLNTENVAEAQLQSFFESHPELLEALGGYCAVYPHLCLRDEDDGLLVPDFILELPGGSGFDILDIKLPRARLSARTPYLRPSADLMKAVAQLKTYEGFFDKARNRQAFLKKYGMEPFKPELRVIMGRSRYIAGREQRVSLSGQISGIRLCTYDELLEYGRARSLLVPEHLKGAVGL